LDDAIFNEEFDCVREVCDDESVVVASDDASSDGESSALSATSFSTCSDENESDNTDDNDDSVEVSNKNRENPTTTVKLPTRYKNLCRI